MIIIDQGTHILVFILFLPIIQADREPVESLESNLSSLRTGAQPDGRRYYKLDIEVCGLTMSGITLCTHELTI